jgi:hypothetical protein
MTLIIKPVRLKQSIYFRVPSDIADLIGIDADAGVTLSLEEQDERFLLIYSVRKNSIEQTTGTPSHDMNDEGAIPIPKPRVKMQHSSRGA